ncbi:hypothetical protein LAZ67_3003870 [Cordylochernes scorpioides]|uniref:Histone-lysine N-methyltransferase SETMAR n=1 Tax=Cordylochernes scorpioides TaxID=51811 RepID=A0ABY6KCA5_9ARAC|nr:hypothetical protein LAZ67_3003870 [Cordylochernes scorpioides]
MDIKNVRKWCREFNEGRINVHDEQRSGRPSFPESTVARIDEMVRANRRITLEEIEDGLNEDFSHFSVHKIVSETLGYRKVSARQRMNSDLYCDILVKRLKPGIRNKRRGKLIKGVLFLHDNARTHTSCETVSTIIKFSFEVLEHPAYSPDPAPSGYFLFGLLKKELKGKRFDSDEDVQKVVQDFFHTLPKRAYKEGIYKLPERWRRCIESQGDYILSKSSPNF